jgi:hypothetical protein
MVRFNKSILSLSVHDPKTIFTAKEYIHKVYAAAQAWDMKTGEPVDPSDMQRLTDPMLKRVMRILK